MGSYGENTLVRGLGFLAEKQAAIANNLANVDTTSFKRRLAVAQDTPSQFESLLGQQMPTISYTEQSDFGRGVTRETGNLYDVAIDGDCWLRVQNQQGANFYSRNGQLQINSEGRLVNRNGLSVLDQNGQPMQIGSGDDGPSSISISPNGSVQNPTTGQVFGTLAVVSLPRPDALVPVGKGLYTDPTNQAPTQAGDNLQQGYLEGSNVDSLQELVQMIAVERSFTATQKALTGLGRLQENLISNILR
jgi:flagellar basal body rod protein FlgG